MNNSKTDNYYVVLDFEMCTIPKNDRKEICGLGREIIQIGAVLLDEHFSIINEFNQFVKPQYGRIDAYIKSLTGITWNKVQNAPLLNDAIDVFAKWIPEGNVKVVSWSDADLQQLSKEMKSKGINNAKLEYLMDDKWIDSQAEYAKIVGTDKKWSLEEALIASDIFFRGHSHDGLDDAYNTGLLYAKMMTESVFSMNKMYMDAKNETLEHLSSSIGELFAGLGFAACAT